MISAPSSSGQPVFETPLLYVSMRDSINSV
jgi:hypothetical protein